MSASRRSSRIRSAKSVNGGRSASILVGDRLQAAGMGSAGCPAVPVVGPRGRRRRPGGRRGRPGLLHVPGRLSGRLHPAVRGRGDRRLRVELGRERGRGRPQRRSLHRGHAERFARSRHADVVRPRYEHAVRGERQRRSELRPHRPRHGLGGGGVGARRPTRRRRGSPSPGRWARTAAARASRRGVERVFRLRADGRRPVGARERAPECGAEEARPRPAIRARAHVSRR